MSNLEKKDFKISVQKATFPAEQRLPGIRSGGSPLSENSKNIFTDIRGFIFRHKAYFLSFLLPAAVLFIAYIIFGVYPFGERSVLALDLNAQYVCYFDYMYDVFAGRESIFYCWSRSLSGEFLGLFAYYLASPLNFVVWLFPRENITEGILTMLLVKSAATGLASAVLLKKQRGFSDITVILFSAMYALSGYFTAHTLNPMWLDGLIALPLVMMGVERICDKRKFLLYTVSLVYVFVANFYIGYMVGIFSAIYFLYYFLSGSCREKGLKKIAGGAAVYGFSSVAAILISCPIIVPVYKSLSLGKFAFGEPDYSPAENFDLADMLIKLFPATYDTIRPEGLPMIYCGTLALVFAVIYFLTGKISLRKRIASGFLLGILALSMYIKPVDMLWHGGQVPVWMPYRYSFIFAFLIVMFGAEAFENFISESRARSSQSIKKIGVTFAILLGVLLFSDYYAGNQFFDTKLIIVIPLVFTAVICAAAVAFKRLSKRRVCAGVLTALVFGELLLNAVVTFNRAHDDVYYSSRESYLGSSEKAGDIPETRKIMRALREYDNGFYRAEKTYHRTVNDPMAVGMYGLSHSTSTFNAKVISLLKTLGIGAREHYSRSDGMTMLFDDIFGIRYVLSKYSALVPYEDTVEFQNNADISVYENSDALGIAYLADIGVVGSGIDGSDPFAAQSSLARLLSGGLDEIFHPIYDMVFDCDNVTIGSTTDAHISYKKREGSNEASVSYQIIMPHKGKAYAYFPTDYERECKLYVNGNYVKNYFENENHSIAYLGDYRENEAFEVSLKLNKDSLYIKEAQFFYLDEEELLEFNRKMRDMNMRTSVVKKGGSTLDITVNAAEDCALFTTIPIEEGWTAAIDGKQAQILPCVNNTLLCVRVPEGEHTITLKFFPAGLKTGLILMAAGLTILAAMILLSRFDVIQKLLEGSPKKTDDTDYEEGFDG